VKLLDDAENLKTVFGQVTPDFGSTKNPIDLTGGATSDHYTGALDAALKDGGIDAVIALYCETAVFDAENLAPMIRENFAKYRDAGKPIVFSAFGGASIDATLHKLSTEKVPIFGDVYDAVRTLGGIYRQYENLARPQPEPQEAEVDVAAIERLVAGARADGRTFLLANEGRQLMELPGFSRRRAG